MATPTPPDPENEKHDQKLDEVDISSMTDESLKDLVEVEDSKTSAAVGDIIRHESDELLAADDEANNIASGHHPETFREKVKRWFSAWWNNKKIRYATLAGLALLFVVIIALPFTRYGILNALGARAGTSLTVLDNTTQLPLKGANVTLGGQQAQTDKTGVAHFAHLKLGKQKLAITKIAFASVNRNLTLGWGSNPLGNVPLKAVGTQYTIIVTDYLSTQPIAKAEAASGEASAVADSHGKIILTVSPTQGQTIPVTISSTSYHNLTVNLQLGATAVTTVHLVPDGEDIFVSKASGKYDVYKADLDGKNRNLLLTATGNENSNISLLPSPDQKKVALINTRDNMHDADGYLLYTLTLIDIDKSSVLTLDHGESIQPIGWNSTYFIYQETFAATSAANTQRSRIVAYNYATNSRVQLATANYFNAVTAINGYVYYAVSSSDPTTAAGLYRINPDGTNRQTVIAQEVWTVLRPNYTTLNLQTPNAWFGYTIGGKAPASVPAPNQQTYSFVDSPDGSQSLWVDNRDGKGVLLVHDASSMNDKVLQSQDGLSLPLVWVGNSIAIYRVTTPQETADYVISTQSGTAHKITDVTSTFGVGQG